MSLSSSDVNSPSSPSHAGFFIGSESGGTEEDIVMSLADRVTIAASKTGLDEQVCGLNRRSG